jgi:hypothetical protein
LPEEWDEKKRAAKETNAAHAIRPIRKFQSEGLVARAVALNVDVRVAEDVTGFLVAAHESPDIDEVVHRYVPADDVPATLARLLDEVEAARK